MIGLNFAQSLPVVSNRKLEQTYQQSKTLTLTAGKSQICFPEKQCTTRKGVWGNVIHIKNL